MTAEFAERLTLILGDLNMSKVEAARLAGVHSTEMIRVTHGDRELGPDKAFNFAINAGIPPSQQALFLLQAAGAPEEIATLWLDALGQTAVPLRKSTLSELLKRYVPTALELNAISAAMGKENSGLRRHWNGDKLRKSIELETRLQLCERLTRLPNEEKAQFFLIAAGFDLGVVKEVLENYQGQFQPAPVLTSEQEQIVSAGYKPTSIAVQWNIDPTARTIPR